MTIMATKQLIHYSAIVSKNTHNFYECQSKRRQTETSTEKNAGPKSKRRQQNFQYINLNQNVDTFL